MIELLVLSVYILTLWLIVWAFLRAHHNQKDKIEFVPPWDRPDIDPDSLYTMRVLLERSIKDLVELKQILGPGFNSLSHANPAQTGIINTINLVSRSCLEQSIGLTESCVRIIENMGTKIELEQPFPATLDDDIIDSELKY